MSRTSADPRWKAFLWPCVAALAGVVAYWPIGGGLLLAAFSPDRPSVDRWLFAPATAPAGGTLLIAAWMAWRRLRRLGAPPERREASRLVAAPLLAGAAVLLAWGSHTGAPHVLCLSLLLLLPAVGALFGGRRGLVSMLSPAAVVLLAVPIPYPLLGEVVWTLQRWTASGALWLMQLGGLDAAGSGVRLYHAGATFLVIEECSGLRAIRTLLIASLLIGDLCDVGPRRRALLLALAPLLSVGLNMLRVALIAADPPEQVLGQSDHLGQGIGTLVAGSALLYLAAQVGRGRPTRAPDATPMPGAAPRPWRPLAAWLTGLCVIALAVPAASSRTEQARPLPALPVEHAGWNGSDLDLDRLFIGMLPIGRTLHRRYEVASSDPSMKSVVQLFVAGGTLEPGNAALYSPKLLLPGAAWTLESTEPNLDWDVERRVAVTIASRGEQRALIYSWLVGDRGIARESLRSLLALDLAEGAVPRPRAIIRLSTPMGDHPRARQRAARRLDRFVRDYAAFWLETGAASPPLDAT